MLRLFLLLQIFISSFYLSSEESLKIFACNNCNIKAMSEIDPHERSKPYLKEIKELIYQKLYKFDDKAYVVNDLIENCKVLKSKINKKNLFLSLECEIKKDILFCDGKNLTTKDVIFSINRLKKSKTLSKDFDFIKKLKAKSPYKLTFTLQDSVNSKKPKRYLIQKFKKTLAMYSYIPSSTYFTSDINWALEYPVGSGDYKFLEWKVWEKNSLSTQIVLERNNKDKFFEKIVFKFLNKIDLKDYFEKEKNLLVLNFNEEFYNAYKKDKNLRFYRKKISSYDYLIFNSNSKNYDLNLFKIFSKIINSMDKNFGFSYINPLETSKKILGKYFCDSNLKDIKIKKYEKNKKINILINENLSNLEILKEIKNKALSYNINLNIVKKSFKEYFEIINSLNFNIYDLILYRMNEDHEFLTTLSEKMFDSKFIQVLQNDFVYLNKNKKIDDKFKVSSKGFLMIEN
jgi:hypothetical protein